ncbi:gag-related protein [Trypanosoma cruzi]|nr:gag-related protein [Trypanosoma cruzi]
MVFPTRRSTAQHRNRCAHSPDATRHRSSSARRRPPLLQDRPAGKPAHSLAATPASNRAAHSQYHSCRVFKRAFARRVGLILAMGIYNVIRSGANTMLSNTLNFIFLKGGVGEFHFGGRKICAGKCP